MNDNKNFGYLGHSFQLKLINLIITDKSFFTSIIDVIIPKLDEAFRRGETFEYMK